uniref:Uncharacterized protein n=1 Tax=Catagonus wagneri TaxID=51154 RepID=A0A8C3WDU2_9CETA
MSVQTPRRLLDLAGTSLLREEAVALSVLEDLPTELFPPLFMEAFDGRHIETLKAMVQVWPFVRLPLGGLMDMPYMGPLQAVLEGIDVLIAQKVRPRRCKLRVLDLRDTGQNFWSMWSGSSTQVYSSSWMAPVADGRSRTKQSLAPLKVFIDLSLKRRTLDNFLTYLSRWVERRKGSILLCCRKLSISAMPMENIKKVLAQVQLDSIQEVQVNCIWKLSTLARFAPLLGQMSNVQKLLLSPIPRSALEEQQQQQQHVVQILSQFLKLHHLRDLYLECPFFLEGRLDQMLRCLSRPLDNLSITYTLLRESDLIHLSQCSNISQLKGLDLSGVVLTTFSPELLQGLLEKVAATLQELDLELCGITDPQFEVILPTLSRCSELRSFSLCGNFLSMANIEKMLRHTARLPNLSHEWYPAPQESYSPQGIPLEGRFKKIQAEVLEILRDLGQSRTIRISLSPCLQSKTCPFLQVL